MTLPAATRRRFLASFSTLGLSATLLPGVLWAQMETSDSTAITAAMIKDAARLSYVTQTTLSVDDADKVVCALRERFPEIIGPKRDDICYATQNRQDAVKELATKTDVVFVVGSQSSSNSTRLREVAELLGARAYLVDEAAQIDPAWLEGATRIGVTAGASAPEVLVQNVIARLSEESDAAISQLPGVAENVTFPLPRELQA